MGSKLRLWKVFRGRKLKFAPSACGFVVIGGSGNCSVLFLGLLASVTDESAPWRWSQQTSENFLCSCFRNTVVQSCFGKMFRTPDFGT